MSSEAKTLELLADELADIKNVSDNADELDDQAAASLFSISSYGIDHPVEGLVKRLNTDQYYIPAFQRRYVWTKNDASRFIESLLLGLPVPGIFLYKESGSSKHLVIDGQQRLKSLQKYYSGFFGDNRFRLSGLKSRFNDLSYEDLTEDDRLRLDDAIVHATVFKQDTPSDNMDSVYEVFERINTGGMKLSPQEIRSCVAYGPFNELLFKMNEDVNWRSIYGKPSHRLKDIELILRFLAFANSLERYSRPMKSFLGDFMAENRYISPQQSADWMNLWEATTEMVVKSIEKPFRSRGPALNAAFYDSFMVALSSRITTGEINESSADAAYRALADDKEFSLMISSNTADDDNVKRRFSRAAEAVADAASH